MSLLDRYAIAAHVLDRLSTGREQLQAQWRRDPISNMVIDDLLPEETARALYVEFPRREQLSARRSLRESRYLGSEPERWQPQLQEALLAFQDERVLEQIARITELPGVALASPANSGGISRMDRGSFLNPHLDPSADSRLQHQQVVGLLYYITPDLRLADGGHLELWHDGPDGEATTILAKFNRLVVMATHGQAWHSVSPVRTLRQRCCIWSYYHAPLHAQPVNDNHVAAYRGRPEQRLIDLLLRAETFARQSMYRFSLERRFATALELMQAPVANDNWQDGRGEEPRGQASEFRPLE